MQFGTPQRNQLAHRLRPGVRHKTPPTEGCVTGVPYCTLTVIVVCAAVPPEGVAVTVNVYAPVVVPGFVTLPPLLLLPPHATATAAITMTTSARGT